MNKMILISISLIIVTGGVFASQDNASRYVVSKTKFSPKLSSLFEPQDDDIVTELEHELFLEDLEDRVNMPISIKPRPENFYASNSRFPWIFGGMKQRDSLALDLEKILMTGNQDQLVQIIQDKDLSSIHRFDDNPLVVAILRGKTEAIAPLAAAGANASMQDRDGADVVSFAYKNSTPLMVEELLKAQQKQQALIPKSVSFSRISPDSIASVSPFCYSQDDDDQQE